jgi:hypothetical protein
MSDGAVLKVEEARDLSRILSATANNTWNFERGTQSARLATLLWERIDDPRRDWWVRLSVKEGFDYAPLLVDLHNRTSPTRVEDRRLLREVVSKIDQAFAWGSGTFSQGIRHSDMEDLTIGMREVRRLAADDLRQAWSDAKKWWRGQ